MPPTSISLSRLHELVFNPPPRHCKVKSSTPFNQNIWPKLFREKSYNNHSLGKMLFNYPPGSAPYSHHSCAICHHTPPKGIFGLFFSVHSIAFFFDYLTWLESLVFLLVLLLLGCLSCGFCRFSLSCWRFSSQRVPKKNLSQLKCKLSNGEMLHTNVA